MPQKDEGMCYSRRIKEWLHGKIGKFTYSTCSKWMLYECLLGISQEISFDVQRISKEVSARTKNSKGKAIVGMMIVTTSNCLTYMLIFLVFKYV